jgi:hypothetical protein
MSARIVALSLWLAVCCAPGCAQTAPKSNPNGSRPSDVQPPPATVKGEHKNDSGPLAWTISDFNPETVFWIQGRFVPVGDANFQGDAEVATILCTVREYECLEIDSTSPVVRDEQAWIDDFKVVNWDKHGILGTTRSLDGCTDETLKVRFSPPSVVIINSPVLPMAEHCKTVNNQWDKLLAKKGSGIAVQTEEDELVPTRTFFPRADADFESGKAPNPAPPKKP